MYYLKRGSVFLLTGTRSATSAVVKCACEVTFFSWGRSLSYRKCNKAFRFFFSFCTPFILFFFLLCTTHVNNCTKGIILELGDKSSKRIRENCPSFLLSCNSHPCSSCGSKKKWNKGFRDSWHPSFLSGYSDLSSCWESKKKRNKKIRDTCPPSPLSSYWHLSSSCESKRGQRD